MPRPQVRFAPPPGLTAADATRLDSQLPAIGAALRDKPLRTEGKGWRVGSSLLVYRSGWWRDHKVGVSGFGSLALIEHFRDFTAAEAISWAQEWLAEHLEMGACDGADNDPVGEADAIARTESLKVIYASRLPIAGTDAATFLSGRALDPAKLRPEIIARLGFLPNFRGNEGALVYPYTNETDEIVGLHLIHIQPGGAKSEIEPIRSTRKGSDTWRHEGKALLRLDHGNGPEMIVTEGLENGLAASLAGYDRVVAVGSVSAFGLCHLPNDVESALIVHDGDDPLVRPAAVQSYHHGIVRYLGQGLQVRMTAPPLGCDPNEILQREGPEGLRKLLAEARGELGRFDNAAFLKELFKLNELSYGRARGAASKILGVTLGTLDKERAATRRRWAETGGEEEVVVPDDLQPWPDPVPEIGPIMDAALAEMQRYTVAAKHHIATAVAWSVQSHLLQREELGIDVATRLAIQSAIKGSGKTTLLEEIYELTPRPELAGAISASAVFRLIDQVHPTLLIDEADNVINKNSNPELLAILNSGHRRKSARVIKSESTPEGKFVPVSYNTFTGIAFAGIKKLPETLQDRSIVVPLQRAMRGEKREHLVNGHSPILVACRRKSMRWAADLQELPKVKLPPWLYNRSGDNWYPLFVVAAMAGGQWPDLITRAAREAVGEENSALFEQLLESLWHIFFTKKVTRMYTAAIVQELLKEDEGPWGIAKEGRPVDAYWLREMLKFALPKPDDPVEEKKLKAARRWRDGSGPTKFGYNEDHLAEAWERYLSRRPPSKSKSSDASDPRAENHAASDTLNVSDQKPASDAVRRVRPSSDASEAVETPESASDTPSTRRIASDDENRSDTHEAIDIAGRSGPASDASDENRNDERPGERHIPRRGAGRRKRPSGNGSNRPTREE